MILPWRDVSVGPTIINTSITTDEANELARLSQGKRVLEIGSAFGYSAIVMARLAESVHAVDPHDAHGSRYAMQSNLDICDLDTKVSIIPLSSRDAVPFLCPTYDMVFIDGDHTYEGIMFDLYLARDKSPLIACHDYGEQSCPGVREALDEFFPGGPSRLVDTLFVWEAR